MPGSYDLHGYRGDTFVLNVTIEDADGNPLVLDPAGWAAQIKRRPDATNPVAEFAIDTTDAADGKLVLTLAAADTAELPERGVWDLQQQITTSTRTYLFGETYFGRDVTR